MASATPRVFTIPGSLPFLPTLIRALADGTLTPDASPPRGPLGLAKATLYLPTRRACRLARDAFLDGLGVEAAVLPRIVPLGDIDEDELAFDEAAGAAEPLDLPPALSGLARRLTLARLVLGFAERMRPQAEGEPPLVVGTPTAALALADHLARLIDDMTVREIPWDRLDTLVPDELDEYWRLTLRFLTIAREEWPRILAERQAIEPATRRDRVIAAEAARLARKQDGPVIVAGSTGSMPATARFIAAVARLPHGAIVLPGLDTHLDAESWALTGRPAQDGSIELESGHPQYAMHSLLKQLGLDRIGVAVLGGAPAHDRAALLSEALRPAATTDLWRSRLAEPGFADKLAASLSGLAVIEAGNADEEALAIAVALREAVEERGRTAALATPDRALARRVAAALARWDIVVADSGGDSLGNTAAGIFARLAAETALGHLAPAPLLALLKHPLCRLGARENADARAVAALERAVLRGPRPRAGSKGLADALANFRSELAKLRHGEPSTLHPSEPRALVSKTDLAAAENLVARLAGALAPLEDLDSSRSHPLSALAARHREVVTALGADESGSVAALAGADGTALDSGFDEIIDEPAAAEMMVATTDYPELFRTAIADRVVRQPPVLGSRVQILGLLEARLVAVDRMVLGGLVEEVWPPKPHPDPWLNRGMRHALGLDLPERRVGLSAHDFAQLISGAPDIVLTRAGKIAGAPAVPSRFLQRLAAVAGERWDPAVRRGQRYLALARSLDRLSHPPRRVPRPAPCPPRAARPISLSVTEIEHWLRDPYTIYAKHILKLPRLDAVDLPPGAKDRGIAIHNAIGEFATAYPAQLPDDPEAELLRIGGKHFAALNDYPEARAFWWPRFEAIARWFVRFERERRAAMTAALAEIRGTLTIALGERSFRLSARADRIEQLAGGGYAILDFKTGAPPSSNQVRIGMAPQLTLEGAILRKGGFPGVPAAASLAELTYVRLTGGEPAGKTCKVELEELTPDAAADHALARFIGLLHRFEEEAMPYRSLVLPMWKNRYGTYDDLARVKEWSAGEEGEEE
ncbi:MAG TPA: double-strand break repair protein AddB [Rhodoplanes sp.]|nr:double-strand break repair protein AddB [Rhodoplanes sp.]